MKKIRGPVLSAGEKIQTKIRITTFLDEDLLNILRQLARDSGGKYQTLLNQILRSALLDARSGLVSRIDNLEKAVFKSFGKDFK